MLLFFLIIHDSTISANYTSIPPRIDGVIEELWLSADSAYNFHQYIPYDNRPASELTKVYVLYDDENLYVGFRCFTPGRKPVSRLGGKEDNVVLYLDPMESNTNAYYFQTKASGAYSDGRIFDDGLTGDDSWDGVWYQAVHCYEDRFEVEMQIPFKTIRYKKGLDEWGINFKRYIVPKQEYDTWTQYTQKEGFKVSGFGRLKGINPGTQGYYFELYPIGVVRYEKQPVDSGFRPLFGVNTKWDITPQTTLNATVNPDFAQIEADPYTLNLSRYPVKLQERRPFFIETEEIFRLSQGPAPNLDIYYSRMIGKSVNQNIVPIYGGCQLSHHGKRLQYGLLGAWTGAVIEDSIELEPEKGFGVLRVKNRFFKNSLAGILMAGAVNESEQNLCLGIDGIYRAGINQFAVQGAVSDKDRKTGYALTSGICLYLGDFYINSSGQYISDSFDVSEIGYIPWPGLKNFVFKFGLAKYFGQGFLKHLNMGPGIFVNQEPGDSNWTKLLVINLNPVLRSGWGCNASLNGGTAYRMGQAFFNRSLSIFCWGGTPKFRLHFGGWAGYDYNYFRGWFAYQLTNFISVDYSLINRLSFSFSLKDWCEIDSNDKLYAITPRLTPRLEYWATKDISISIYNQTVLSWYPAEGRDFDLQNNRFGVVLSYNFRPKCWFYLALNDYRENIEGHFSLVEQLGAIKIKYLLYF